jgi:protein-tyrosine phosphatase
VSDSRVVSVCFVCLGNICRSPTAEGVMHMLVREAKYDDRIRIDSAGTGAYHVGERADARSREEARRRGVELTSIARQFERRDFVRFDYVIAMDSQNLRNLRALGGSGYRDKLHLLRSFDPDSLGDLDVPDPYYGGVDGFARVFDICVAGCRGLLAHIEREHGLARG